MRIAMEIKIIKTSQEYEKYLEWIDEMFDKKVNVDSPEGEMLQIVLLLIKQYEDIHYPIPVPDPIAAIRMKMAESGMRNKDLVGRVGSKGYVSALLNKRKPLTLELVKFFHKEFNIPAEILLS
jgi:HTH-type transcriptional regulator/antitoxin HigA